MMISILLLLQTKILFRSGLVKDAPITDTYTVKITCLSEIDPSSSIQLDLLLYWPLFFLLPNSNCRCDSKQLHFMSQLFIPPFHSIQSEADDFILENILFTHNERGRLVMTIIKKTFFCSLLSQQNHFRFQKSFLFSFLVYSLDLIAAFQLHYSKSS